MLWMQCLQPIKPNVSNLLTKQQLQTVLTHGCLADLKIVKCLKEKHALKLQVVNQLGTLTHPNKDKVLKLSLKHQPVPLVMPMKDIMNNSLVTLKQLGKIMKKEYIICIKCLSNTLLEQLHTWDVMMFVSRMLLSQLKKVDAGSQLCKSAIVDQTVLSKLTYPRLTQLPLLKEHTVTLHSCPRVTPMPLKPLLLDFNMSTELNMM